MSKALKNLAANPFLFCDVHRFKANNQNTTTGSEIYSKLTIMTPERRIWRLSGVFIANFEHISHLVPVFLSLTLSR